MIALLLAACADGGAAGVAGASNLVDYAGEAGTRLAFAPKEAPEVVTMWIDVGDGVWEARGGPDWDTASPVGSWAVKTGESLSLDGDKLLGPNLPEVGETTTWYGTFSPTLVGKPKTGAFAGRWVFAERLGPIVVTVDGVETELVYYERGVDSGE